MAAPVIYRSTDVNAPVLFGGNGSLITLLDACLVNGYGSVFATGTLTNDGTNVADGDTITIGSVVYTFKATLGVTAYNVQLGANAAASCLNLANAINGPGVALTTSPAGTLPHPDVYTSYPGSGTVLSLVARKGGTTGNSIALARSSAGTPHFTVSGATMAGGSGTDSKASLGWTKSYTGASWQQAAYRQPAGSGFYFQVDDSGPGAGGSREARSTGWETMTAYNTGTGQFPTPAQISQGAVIRKSTSQDGVVRAWTLIGDDRTFYLFTYSGDTTGNAHGIGFGDFYSFLTGDAYKCMIVGGAAETASTSTTTVFGMHHQAQAGNIQTGHWLPRNYSGVGGSTGFVKLGDGSLTAFGSASSPQAMIGQLGFPNFADGGLYVSPLRVVDGSAPGAGVNGTLDLRGRIRGLYFIPHSAASFADGDTFSGAGDYAGRNFFIAKIVGSAMMAVETTAWDTSA